MKQFIVTRCLKCGAYRVSETRKGNVGDKRVICFVCGASRKILNKEGRGIVYGPYDDMKKAQEVIKSATEKQKDGLYFTTYNKKKDLGGKQ